MLPQVVSNWDSMSEDKQQSMLQMYNFFCGMHLVVNMAETVSESLKLFEKAHMEDTQMSDSESGTIRLMRTVCKAFERRGNEKSGYPLQFNTYLNKHGIEHNPLIHFHGNRFSVIFANFLTNVWGTPNRLLKSVLEDVSNEVHVAGCKALGLISKHITGPLWRILESNLHILDLPQYYQRLLTFVSNCKIPSGFMTGEEVPFPEVATTKDSVWIALVTQSTKYDHLVAQILLSCFKSIEVILGCVISDQEPAVAAAKRKETISVKKTNTTISERDFAKLDWLLREKPHATMLSLEAHILFSNNKTKELLEFKSPEELKSLMETARKSVPKHKQKFKERLSANQAHHTELQQKQEQEKQAAKQRLLLQKARITTDMIEYSLWQTQADINNGLKLCKSETQKHQAIQSQLRFRKTVLEQTYDADKDIYKSSTKYKGQLNSTALKDNLLKLINAAANQCSSGCTGSDSPLVSDT